MEEGKEGYILVSGRGEQKLGKRQKEGREGKGKGGREGG